MTFLESLLSGGWMSHLRIWVLMLIWLKLGGTGTKESVVQDDDAKEELLDELKVPQDSKKVLFERTLLPGGWQRQRASKGTKEML